MYTYHKTYYDNTELWRVIRQSQEGKIIDSRTFKSEEECKKYIEEQKDG